MHARACVVALSSDACSSSENSSSKLSGNESEIHFALEAMALGGGVKKKRGGLMHDAWSAYAPCGSLSPLRDPAYLRHTMKQNGVYRGAYRRHVLKSFTPNREHG